MKIKSLALLLSVLLLLTGCIDTKDTSTTSLPPTENKTEKGTEGQEKTEEAARPQDTPTEEAYGEDLYALGAYDGYFEDASKDFEVTCLSGTKNAYRLEGTTLTFTAVGEDSVYSISGTFRGNIVINTGDLFKFDLELHGFSLVCDTDNPIYVKSGDEVAIKAKKNTKNYVYDMREAVSEESDDLFAGAIRADVDLEIGGKGTLILISENNNGIHSKKDLQLKNLTLLVACTNNALKGNDSVEISGAHTTLISSAGDGIKTVKSNISEKGKQRGTVSITGGTHTIYAACDGIDAAYDVRIDGSLTALDIYTDKYSAYSKEVSSTSSDENYIRFTSDQYAFAVKYYNSESDYVWVNAEYHSTVSSGRTNYYYYSYPKMQGYEKQQFFIYESEELRGQEENCLVKSDYLTKNDSFDTFALTPSHDGLYYQWTSYTTKIREGGFGGGHGGFGGMGDGNTEKGDHSAKGIKAANEIIINAGVVNIQSYDDAIHANNDTTLENGVAPLGNVTQNGGKVTIYTNDDGVHADGTLTIRSGTLNVTNAYEGLEGAQVQISGGNVSILSKDDGINGTASSGTAIEISGGTVYIDCKGDGLDSNSRTSYSGILISGGQCVVISLSSMNSALDTEAGYTYTGGELLAIMPRGGMANEATHCQNFSSVGNASQISLTDGHYLVCEVGNKTVTVKIPDSFSAYVIVLGDSSPNVTTKTDNEELLDEDRAVWH